MYPGFLAAWTYKLSVPVNKEIAKQFIGINCQPSMDDQFSWL
jgi:hypothetical protein